MHILLMQLMSVLHLEHLQLTRICGDVEATERMKQFALQYPHLSLLITSGKRV